MSGSAQTEDGIGVNLGTAGRHGCQHGPGTGMVQEHGTLVDGSASQRAAETEIVDAATLALALWARKVGRGSRYS